MSVIVAIRGLSRAMGTYATRADIDPLTGVLNRRGVMDGFMRRTASPDVTHLVVIMIDLDNFKFIDDTYGHGVGDQVPVGVADVLKHSCPRSATICRSGGEEFLIALTTGDVAEAQRIPAVLAQRMKLLPRPVNASIGTATMCWTRRHATDPRDVVKELIGAADAAMYGAKRSGGDQVRHAQAHSDSS
jgi:diguanylate cyclase (GGDEF)-like protein